jgi:hypothetical protein
MFSAGRQHPQIYTPFGTFVVEQRDTGFLKRYLDDLPRPDVRRGQSHPLARDDSEESA